MSHSRQRFFASVLLILTMLLVAVPRLQASSWETGLDMLVVLAFEGDAELSQLRAQLNRLLALATPADRITVISGTSSSQKTTLEGDRYIDGPTFDLMVHKSSSQQGRCMLSELLTIADSHFGYKGPSGKRPLVVVLDHGGLANGDNDEAPAPALDQPGHRQWLITGITTRQTNDLEQMLGRGDGLVFAPEDAAAEHRAMVGILAEARGNSRLPLTDGYLPVDESCQQLTLILSGHDGQPLVARPNGSLLDLDGDGLLWTEGDTGITITVQTPEPGFWRVLGEEWSGEAILTSPLRLGRLPTLSSYMVGEPVTLLAYLAEGDRLSPDQYPYALTVRAHLLGPSQTLEEIAFYDDGRHGDGVAKDGLYGAQVQLNIPGPYQLRYLLQRGLLAREETVSLKVVEPDGQERRYTLSPERIDLPHLVPGRTYEQTITLTSHLPKVERFRFETGETDNDLRSFGELVVSPSEVELGPGETRTITLAVRLEQQAALGGYAGHLRLVPASATQRGQIVPLRLGVVPWPIAHWRWLAAGGAGLFVTMLTVSVALSRPQLQGWLSNEALGGHECVPLRGHHFMPSPTSHRAYLAATRGGGLIRVHLYVDHRDPPVLVNGVPVTRSSPLNDGDQLRLGQVIWEYREDQPADEP